jgi:hypothetical protein
MSDVNKKRDWRVFEHLYNRLLSHYESVLKNHHKTHIIKEVKDKVVKLIDSTTMSLCLPMFNWAECRTPASRPLDYFCNQVKEGAKKILCNSQIELKQRVDLFSG